MKRYLLKNTKVKLRDRFQNYQTAPIATSQDTAASAASELDDRKAWLSSIAQAVVGKTLETLRDDDEPQLYDKLKNFVLGSTH
ncbi:MAG: hypothetical protein IPK76_09865 [Lewinellaceae bacterium]|nr:hypothetical protein [Lewinellaceae bacterium]